MQPTLGRQYALCVPDLLRLGFGDGIPYHRCINTLEGSLHMLFCGAALEQGYPPPLSRAHSYRSSSKMLTTTIKDVSKFNEVSGLSRKQPDKRRTW